MNLLKNCKVDAILGYYAAGQTKRTSDIIDMSGYEGVLFVALLGTIIEGGTIDVTTTTSWSRTLEAECPMLTRTPLERSYRMTGESDRSEPVTRNPCLTSSSAMPLKLIPPMPTKWIFWDDMNIQFTPRPRAAASTAEATRLLMFPAFSSP